MENILGIRYLPDWRYTGNESRRGDYEMILHLHRPKVPKTERLPLVMYVHGGAYGAGSLMKAIK